ncbi:MAG: hypothetical protein ACOX7J_03510 [Bacillota bacterium]|jgi:exopolyphosphatase/guanosine-5'-triphosphate,3'-diphosphate pyrophosphatase
MIKAAVDIGSNSVRLLIGQVENGRVLALSQHLRTTRLGKTVKGGRLNAEAVARTLAALADFKKIVDKFGVRDNPVVAATSAVREAADKDDFARLILENFGWDLEILSGESEAEMSYLGATSVVEEAAAVIDVGGGSTELIFAEDGKITGKSAPVGAVRLHLGEAKREDLPMILEPLKKLFDRKKGSKTLVGVGGTITSLAAMKHKLREYSRQSINGTVITKEELASYYNELRQLEAAEILKKYPLLKNREDIICDGIAIYLVLADLLAFREIIVSDAGILDGLLLR